MTCSSATFNPAVTHPASLSTEPDDEYFFCVQGMHIATRKETYAQAKVRIKDETLSLVFKVQISPFAEMLSTLVPWPDFTNAPEPYWIVRWIQKPNHQTKSWTRLYSTENSEKIQRIFFNVRWSLSESPNETLVSISNFRHDFENVNPRESAYLVQWGLKTANLKDLLIYDNPTAVCIKWE